MFAIVYLNVALYSLCFQLQAPVEPYLVKMLVGPKGDAAVGYASLQSWASMVYTFGSLAMGLLLDIWGMRQSFVICFASTSLSYALLSTATSVELLFLSRVPTFFQHGFLLSQALLLQETSEEERAGAIGRVSLAYTFGNCVAPVAGGIIASSGDLYLGARIAACASLFSAALCLLLPARTSVDQRAGPSSPAPQVLGRAKEGPSLKLPSEPLAGPSLPLPTVMTFPFKLLGIPKLRALLSRPVLLVLILLKVAGSTAESLTRTGLPLLLMHRFGFSPVQMGETLGSQAFTGGVVGALAVGPLTRRCSPGWLLKRCLLLRMVLDIAAGAATLNTFGAESKGLFLLCIGLQSLVNSIHSHVLTVYTTSAVNKDERGTLMGLEHAINSFPTILSPILAGLLYHAGGVFMVWGTAGAVSGLAFMLIRRRVEPRYRTKDP